MGSHQATILSHQATILSHQATIMSHGVTTVSCRTTVFPHGHHAFSQGHHPPSQGHLTLTQYLSARTRSELPQLTSSCSTLGVEATSFGTIRADTVLRNTRLVNGGASAGNSSDTRVAGSVGSTIRGRLLKLEGIWRSTRTRGVKCVCV